MWYQQFRIFVCSAHEYSAGFARQLPHGLLKKFEGAGNLRIAGGVKSMQPHN
jgi:hypothetical protein